MTFVSKQAVISKILCKMNSLVILSSKIEVSLKTCKNPFLELAGKSNLCYHFSEMTAAKKKLLKIESKMHYVYNVVHSVCVCVYVAELIEK